MSYDLIWPWRNIWGGGKTKINANACSDRPSYPTVTAARGNSTAESAARTRGSAQRARKEKLRFLYDRPSFQPQIIQQVPDFSRLHKELQTENLRKTQRKDVIKCQPFCLRTSVLPARRRRTSTEMSQVDLPALILYTFVWVWVCVYISMLYAIILTTLCFSLLLNQQLLIMDRYFDQTCKEAEPCYQKLQSKVVKVSLIVK